jgi:hypothetical protein
MMFDTKVFDKETIEFSVAPDPTKEDILRVRSCNPDTSLCQAARSARAGSVRQRRSADL